MYNIKILLFWIVNWIIWWMTNKSLFNSLSNSLITKYNSEWLIDLTLIKLCLGVYATRYTNAKFTIFLFYHETLKKFVNYDNWAGFRK